MKVSELIEQLQILNPNDTISCLNTANWGIRGIIIKPSINLKITEADFDERKNDDGKETDYYIL